MQRERERDKEREGDRESARGRERERERERGRERATEGERENKREEEREGYRERERETTQQPAAAPSPSHLERTPLPFTPRARPRRHEPPQLTSQFPPLPDRLPCPRPCCFPAPRPPPNHLVPPQAPRLPLARLRATFGSARAAPMASRPGASAAGARRGRFSETRGADRERVARKEKGDGM